MNQSLLVVLAIVFCLTFLASVSARRDLIRQRLRYLLAIAVFGVLGFSIGQKFTDQTTATVIGVVAGFAIAERFRPRHSRYISRRDRRRVIAKFERDGERYDPKKHEIDHEVPYSRGGGNTSDNLRVISKARNRAKSDRAPWWDLFG